VIGAIDTPSKGGRSARDNPIGAQPLDPEVVVRAVGHAVAAARKRCGLTQKNFAAEVGVSTKYLQRVEAGTQNLTITSLVGFANALRIDWLDLLGATRTPIP
jgi:ribosome-binding protein aMBF1 (putative translation factor)